MRDISGKFMTARSAVASATLRLAQKTIAMIRKGAIPKGDPLPVAKIAAVQAAKNTSQLIPYCHPLPIDFVDCRFEMGPRSITVTTEVKATYKTGVEMEALAAASAAALTLYDMLKMVDQSMEITSIRLVKKKGGKSDFQPAGKHRYAAAVLVVSDSVSARRSRDASGKLIAQRLREEGFRVASPVTVPDEEERIREKIIQWADQRNVDLILTTGGTGLGPRDRTPEATETLLDRSAGGIAETLRAAGQTRTPFSMFSRGKAGVRGKTLVVNLPGSPRAVADALRILLPTLHHAFATIAGASHRKRKNAR